MAGDLKAKLVIEAQANGAGDIIKLGQAVDQLGGNASTSAPELQEMADELEQLATEAAKARQVLADRELLGVRAHADIQKEIEETRAAYARLKASGVLSQTELAQAAMKTGERVRELQGQTNGWAESLGKAKGAIGVLAGSVAGLGAAVSKAVEFESAMADVAKVVGGTDEQVEQLAGQIQQMSRSIPLAATELAAMAAAGGQLGVPIEKLDEFVRLSAQMATAFGMSADQAGEAVAKLSNIFNLPMEQVQLLGDAINTLGNNMAAKEADIVEVLTRIGGAAGQFGLSAEQAGALGASMLSLGVSAEVAGTGINAILAKLQTAGIQGKDFQEALAGMGLSAKQLAADIEANPQKALEGFLQTLAKLEGAQKAEVLAKLFGQEYQDDVARLLAGLGQYEKALGLVADKAATAGAMQREFETRAKTTAAQMQLLRNGVDEVVTNLGSAFLPLVNMGVGALKGLTSVLADLTERFPALSGMAAVLAVATAGAAGAKVAYGAFAVVAAKAADALRGVVGASVSAASAQAGLAASAKGAATAYTGLGAAADGARAKLAGLGAVGKLSLGVGAAAAVVELVQLARATADYAQARGHMNQAQTQGEQLDAAMAQRLREISEATGLTVKSFEEVMQAQQNGLIVQDAATGQWHAATQAQQALAPALRLTAQALAEQNMAMANASAGALVAQFDEATAKAGKTEAAIKALADSLQFGNVQGASAFALALDELATKGRLSAEQVDQAWQQALDGLGAGQIGVLRAHLDEAGRQGVLSAQQVADAHDQVLGAALARAGVNAAQAMGEISAGAQAAVDNVELVADAAVAAGASAEQTGRALELAFTAAIPKADSAAALDALTQRLQALHAAGLLGAQGLERVQSMLTQQRASIEATTPGIQSLQEALRQLGVRPQADLDALARKAREAFEYIRSSGGASAREMADAWRVMAETQIAASGGVASAALQAQAAQHGFVVQVDQTGKAVIKTMAEATAATMRLGAAAKQSGQDAAQGAQQAAEATAGVGQGADEVAQAHQRAGQVITGTWLSAAAQASRYRDEAAAYAWELEGQWQSLGAEVIMGWDRYLSAQRVHIQTLTRYADQYVQALERLDERQQALERRTSGAARGVEDLRLRLLELQGTEEEVAQARSAREREEVQRQLQLTELTLERAALRRDKSGQAAAQEELTHLREQLALLDQISAAEQTQRQQRAAQEAAQQRQSSQLAPAVAPAPVTTQADVPAAAPAPAATASVRSMPVTINLTVNGISDPVRLAKLLEPELRKLERLAR